MKKIFMIFIAICSLFVITGCELSFDFGNKTETEEKIEKYTISFYTFNMVETPESIKDVTSIPVNLPKLSVDGYEFYGWYYDISFTKKAFNADLLTGDITLYAKFVEIVEEQTPTGPLATPTPTPTTPETTEPTVTPTEDLNTPTVDVPTQNPVTPPVTGGEPTPTPTVPSGPVFDDTNKLISSKTCEHVFVNYECSKCDTEYDAQVYNIFKSNTIIYDNDSSNPYNINLDKYGSDVKVIFYDADTRRDIYSNVTKDSFYSNYSYAKSYEEAYFRTQHNFMSGDITDQEHLTPTGKIMSGSTAVKCTTAIYILDYQGSYIGYIPNSLTGDNHVIWYGGAYISHDDVAAYLLAFGSVPANSNYDKGSSGKKNSVAQWGKYGRVNIGTYSNDTSKYPYEPKLCANDGQKYTETDFGTTDVYYTGTRKQTIYNNGSSITRGAARYCFVNNKKSIDERYVFYTYNHYYDYQEYLNYIGGFGARFGYETAGYVYDTTNGTPTQYATVSPILKTYKDLLNLV